MNKYNKSTNKAFTLLEMIFVIVIIGIVANVGVDILKQTYTGYITSTVDNKIQNQTNLITKQIARLLENRINESVIVRSAPSGAYKALNDSTVDDNATIIEWVAVDNDGWLGRYNGSYNKPIWSGFIDVDAGEDLNNDGIIDNNSSIYSPETNTSLLDDHIQSLSPSGAGVDNSAIIFIGANSNYSGFGWSPGGNNDSLVRIRSVAGNIEEFEEFTNNSFKDRDVYEFYKLSWTANALVLSSDGNLTFYNDYRPWEGDDYSDGTGSLMMENVETLRFKSVGDVIKFQICISDDNVFLDDGYSYCKEKAVF